MGLCRIKCYKEIEKYFNDNGWPEGNILGISGLPTFIQKNIKKKNTNSITMGNAPDIDIHNMPYEDNRFDMAVADMVIEHIKNPFLGLMEMHRVLKPGGIAVVTSACFYPKHYSFDHWRFLPSGLRLLCDDFSKIHLCGSWGSKRVVNFIVDVGPSTWTNKRNNKPSPKDLEMVDDVDPNWPVVVWIIAEK